LVLLEHPPINRGGVAVNERAPQPNEDVRTHRGEDGEDPTLDNQAMDFAGFVLGDSTSHIQTSELALRPLQR
jgi:hypothetical protein